MGFFTDLKKLSDYAASTYNEATEYVSTNMPVVMPDPDIPPNTLLLMAALIAAERTARFNAMEFKGANSPRIISEVYQSLQLARLVYRRADELELVEM